MTTSLAAVLVSPTWLFISLVVAYLSYKTIYNLFLHPLAKVPGPISTRLSSKWLSMYDIAFGPVVRIAPDELSFSDPSTIREIYGQAIPYKKSPFYEHFQMAGYAGIFETRDREYHRRRRKLLSHTFAASSIRSAEPLIAAQIRNFLAWVTDESNSTCRRPFDVFFGFRMLTFDIVGILFLGSSFNAVTTRITPSFLIDLDLHFQKAAITWNFSYLAPLTSWLPISSWQHFHGSSRRLYDYGCSAFNDYIARYGRYPPENVDLLKIILASNESKDMDPISDEAIAAEIGSLLVGGTDTTSNVLTYLAYELAQQPEWQRRLRKEFEEYEVVFDGGVARFQHHNPDVFPSPYKYDPARWLSASSDVDAMRGSFFAWSRGSRACMGVHLATMQLKLIISALVWGWDITPAEGTTEESMAMCDHFVAIPWDKACRLVFTPVIDLGG